MGPCFSLANLKPLNDGELLRFDPQITVGGEDGYEDVQAINYEDKLYITVEPNNFEYYLWESEASLREAQLSIFLNRTERYDPPEDVSIITPEASMMGIIIALAIVAAAVLYDLYIVLKKIAEAVSALIKEM